MTLRDYQQTAHDAVVDNSSTEDNMRQRMNNIKDSALLENIKTCIKCNETKKVSFFRKRKQSIDGFNNCCTECAKIYEKKYKLKNSKKIKIRDAEWRKLNPDKISAYNKKKKSYYLAQKESNLSYYHDLRSKNIEKRKEIEKKYREQNREKIRLRNAELQKIHPEIDREKSKKRRSKLSNTYVRQLLKNCYGIPCDKAPLALIEAKRNHLQLVREIRRSKKNDKTSNG
jgi:hypothetical protein